MGRASARLLLAFRSIMTRRSYTFSTRDLLMMAALTALGGVTGTYVNVLGDVIQSFLSFAGTNQ